MDIIIPSYSGHYQYLCKLLDTFMINCIDKNEVTINIVISEIERELFNQLVLKYKTLKIKLMIMTELVEKYDGVKISEEDLLVSVGKFNFQSMKKLYGALETNNEITCIFDSECLFIRKFSMRTYINENINKYIYCSKMIHFKSGDCTHAGYMQKCMNELFESEDKNWYLETYLWIFKRDILLEVKKYLEVRCGKITNHKKDFFIEYGYYLYCKRHRDRYPEIEWIDTYKELQNCMPSELFKTWCYKTHPWCMYEHIGLYLCNATYEQIDMTILMYQKINLPIYRLYPNDRMNQIMLLLCKQIKICVSEYCSDTYDFVMKDAFNKRIGVCVSGLYRECDNINALWDFILPMEVEVNYYLSTLEPSIYRTLVRHRNTSRITIDNTIHTVDATNFTYIPPSKPTMVGNTMEMFYKKSTFLPIIDKYDIVVQMRPDLVTFDKKLIDLIYDVLKNYNENTLYTPIMYGSVGIADTFAIGSVNAMKYYMGTYNNLINLGEKYIFNPELITYLQMKTNQFKFYPLKWNYKINWHNNVLLKLWWRYEEALNLNAGIFEQYLDFKTTSYQVIERKFTHYKDKRYVLYNPNSNTYLCVGDKNDVGVSETKISQFNITLGGEVAYRINIKLYDRTDNMNNDGSGWNVFAVPTIDRVYGFGNNGEWAQFYADKENDYYHFASYHSLHVRNREGGFGRYMGVDKNRLVGDLPKCMSTRWSIIEN
jgi:hypothetical protein